MNPDLPKLVPLTAEHDLSSFNCGKPELNKWLGDYALASQKADLARTWALIEDDRVIGYFSLVMGHVRPENAPQKLVRGVPGYPVGMVLLARLAVDDSAFYRRWGFLPVPAQPLKLYRRSKDIRRTLDRA